MKYTLFDTNNGVLIDRTPSLVEDSIRLEFNGAPEGAMAILKGERETHYEALENGACTIPLSGLVGAVTVTVKLFEKTVSEWKCDEIVVLKLEEGRYLVSANDYNLPNEIARLYVENQDIRNANKALAEQVCGLEKRLDAIMTGWSLT